MGAHCRVVSRGVLSCLKSSACALVGGHGGMATLKIKAVNRTNVAAVLVWCDGESETTYAEIQPGA